MVVHLKMGTIGEIFGKFWLKAIRDTFMWSAIMGETEQHEGKGGLNFLVDGTKGGGHLTEGGDLSNFGHDGDESKNLHHHIITSLKFVGQCKNICIGFESSGCAI